MATQRWTSADFWAGNKLNQSRGSYVPITEFVPDLSDIPREIPAEIPPRPQPVAPTDNEHCWSMEKIMKKGTTAKNIQPPAVSIDHPA